MTNDLDEVWAYDEPHESGGNVHVTLTKAQAIAWMHKTHSFIYETDERAFHDWVVIHWAYKEKWAHKENKDEIPT